jgi:hypothetical protein
MPEVTKKARGQPPKHQTAKDAYNSRLKYNRERYHKLKNQPTALKDEDNDQNGPFGVLRFDPIACTAPICDELSQLRYELRRSWVTTCTIGSSKYKNLKLRKEGRQNNSKSCS